MPLHVVRVFSSGFDGCSWSFSSDLVGAVQECVDAGSSVVNMSLGSSVFSSFEETSFQTMADNGLLMIASAGNGSSSSYSYPASYDSIMSVACIDQNQVVASFSQFNDQVELAGPGVNTESTCPHGTYCSKSGTSMASPHVAGVAALVWSHFQEFSNYEIREAMQVTATDLGDPGRDDYYGHGLVNAEALYDYLFALAGPRPSIEPTVTPPPTPNPTSKPSTEPTLSASPTTSAMPTQICGSDKEFVAIANTPGAVKLEPLSSSNYETQLVNLGFDFGWLGGVTTTRRVRVAANGQINVNPYDTSYAFGPDPIGTYNAPRIAIVQEGLAPDDAGDIWVKSVSDDSMIISFEGVVFYYDCGYIDAQATLYANGGVEICYGEGEISRRNLEEDIEPDYHYDYKYSGCWYYGTQNFAAGIEGGENDPFFPNGPPMAYPLPGPYFNSFGITNWDWPSNTCYCFDPVTHEWATNLVTGAPTGKPSTMPSSSVAPSEVPSHAPTITCIDPAWDFSISGFSASCDLATDFPTFCDYPELASYCKHTCDSCAEYECVDSTLTFITPGGTEATCAMLGSLDFDVVGNYCTLSPDLRSICPGTCEVCFSRYLLEFEEDISTGNRYYSDPVSGLTFDNINGMNPITEGFFDNGYFHGTVSGSFSIYNPYGWAASFACPGGSFNLIQVYMTPAWNSDMSYNFKGTKTDGSIVGKTVALGNITQAILYDDWADFTDLVSVDFMETTGEATSTHLVLDDLTVGFSTTCDGASTTGVPPVTIGVPPVIDGYKPDGSIADDST